MKYVRLKFASLVIAVVLSVFVNSENNINSARFLVSIEVKDLPNDKVIVWQHKKQVEVEVRGPSFLVSRVVASPPTVRLELPDRIEGRYTAQIGKRNLNVSAPLQVTSIEPSSVSFTVENKISREVPIRIPKIGVMDEEYKLEEIKIAPTSASVTGPESEVGDLQYIQTEPLELKEMHASSTRELVLRVPGRLTEVVPASIKATIQIINLQSVRDFSNLPVEIRSASGKMFAVEPKEVRVRVSGAKKLVESVSSSHVIPYVRPTSETETKQIPVNVDLPQGVALVSVEPQSVQMVPARNGEGKQMDKSKGKK